MIAPATCSSVGRVSVLPTGAGADFPYAGPNPKSGRIHIGSSSFVLLYYA